MERTKKTTRRHCGDFGLLLHRVGRAQILSPLRKALRNEIWQLCLEHGCKEYHFEVGDAPDTALDLRDGFPADVKADKVAAGGQFLLRQVLACAEFPNLCADGVA